uniref:Thyroid hormone receptor interactor 10a n=1 Tax=Poecilia formosa TaxID=48698 RepID=A0A096MFW3_POEFO
MDWGTELWDQYDIIEKHTQSGLELVEKYVKFVKERTEIEQSYAKQLRNLSKKYNQKRSNKDEPDCRLSSYQSFVDILNEMNDYAGQRELIAENMIMNICIDLTKYLQELKQERKTYLLEAKKAQQSLESTYKQLDSSKKRFEREWREAERAAQYAEKTDQDINATKADVEKAKQQAHMRARVAEDCKNDYAAQLQKYNKEQSQFYFNDMPLIFNKLQDLDERRIRKLGHGYILFSDTEKNVMPIIGKCLEGITKAGTNVNEKNDSMVIIEQNKSGFERPGDLEFEDYSQGINRASSDSSLGTPKGPMDLLGKNKSKNFWLFKRSKLSSSTLTPFSTPPAPSPPNGAPSPKFGRDPLSYCLKEINKTVKPRISSFRTLRRSQQEQHHGDGTFTKVTNMSPSSVLTHASYDDVLQPTVTEDFGHLPPEQRRKRLQQKLEEISKELQKEVDHSEALGKMKDVYEKNPQMGDPASLATQISQTSQNIERLRGELNKYETWLSEAGVRGDTLRYRAHSFNNNGAHEVLRDAFKAKLSSPDGAHSDESTPDPSQAIYAEFDDDFEDEEPVAPIGKCTAMYNFPGSASEGTISMQEGEVLAVVEEDKGDGWTRVRRHNGDEGYIPTSYVTITLNK